jgi:hypothetical protein
MSEHSIVRLPRQIRPPFEVYVNGVLQQLGSDYEIRAGRLAKDRIAVWRWLIGAFGVGTYRQNDSVDVRYESGGQTLVAEGLEISASS